MNQDTFLPETSKEKQDFVNATINAHNWAYEYDDHGYRVGKFKEGYAAFHKEDAAREAEALTYWTLRESEHFAQQFLGN